jgi:hypothetical protein
MLVPAYVAGIIDGEGSIFLRERNPHISVSNTSRVLMEELACFGGHMQVRERSRSIGTLPSWDWAIRGEKAAIMLRACLPYLLIKRDKAVVALAAWASITGSNHAHFVAKARAEMLPLLDELYLEPA